MGARACGLTPDLLGGDDSVDVDPRSAGYRPDLGFGGGLEQVQACLVAGQEDRVDVAHWRALTGDEQSAGGETVGDSPEALGFRSRAVKLYDVALHAATMAPSARAM
jgi:hypothetical protein